MLTINFLGDSITEGALADAQEDTFVCRVGKMFPCLARNYGISGTRIAHQFTPSQDPRYDLDFIRRIDDLDKEADFVVVFGGTNDYGHGDAPFGNLDDDGEDTFCGCLNALFKKLLNFYKKEQIIVIPPLHRIGENNPYGDGSKKEPGEPLSSYREAIIDLGNFYGVHILNIVEEFGRAEGNPLIADGLHPNSQGHLKIAQLICDYINKLI